MNNKLQHKNDERGDGMEDKFGNKLTTPEMSLMYDRNENEFYKAIIEFYGVDTNGPSYEGRVFLNNPRADENTPLNESNGYVGSYNVFGHDGCWGDEGHCEPAPFRTYDSRIHSHVDPVYKSVEATKLLKKYARTRSKFTITVVPRIGSGQRLSDAKDVLKYKRIRVTCYENPAELSKAA